MWGSDPRSLRRLDVELHPAFAALLHDPAIYPAYESRGEAAEFLAMPHVDWDASWLAIADGQPVGFVLSLYIAEGTPPFAQVLLGVLPGWRRRGIARQLLERACDHYRGRAALVRTGVDTRSRSADPFLRERGFMPARHFWSMHRPMTDLAAVEWPAGIRTRVFDGSDAMREEFRHIVHEAFAASWGFVPWTIEGARLETSRPSFRADGLVLAYRHAAVVGFCENIVQGRRGDLDTLGVAPAARGIGLGRALLRWGVAWLQAQPVDRVTLLVDGENDAALRLYRGEGFAVASERVVWELPLP